MPDIRNKVLLLDFWASWCAPCQRSFPTLERLQHRFRTNRVVVLAISVDEDVAAMEAFLKKHRVSFPVVRDATQKLVARADLSEMPTSFILDRSGKVRFVHRGFAGEETEKAYEREIELLLGE